MQRFPFHTVDDAPEASRPVLRSIVEAFGFVPNVAAAMAGSPVLLDSFFGVFRNVHAGTFSEAQIQTLLLTNAVTNRCVWAVAFHTALALQQGLSATDVEAIRRRAAPADLRMAALSCTARRLIEQRGRLEDAHIAEFVAAGFAPEQLLELIAVSAASTMTNYAGSVARPALEPAFQPHAWTG